MGALLLLPLLLTSLLDDNEAFLQAQQLYNAGDPVAAEVALGPLLDGAQPAGDRARLLIWAAMCADASGRQNVAHDRVLAAIGLHPELVLPEQASLRLSKLVEAALKAEGKTLATAPPDPPPAGAEPAPPPVPAASAADESATESAATETAAKSGAGEQSATEPEDAKDKTKIKRSAEKPAEKAPAPEVEEEPTLKISTSLWAVAGGAMTVALLLSAGAAVFGIQGGFVYYESLSANAADAPAFVETTLVQLRLAGILAAVGAVMFAVSGAAAGGAWWLEQE